MKIFCMINYFSYNIFIHINFLKRNVGRILLGLFLLLFIMRLQAQVLIIDTVSQRMNTDTSSWQYKKELSDFIKLKLEHYLLMNTSSWQYKMEQSDDRWSQIVGRKDFQLFFKNNYEGTLKEHGPTANISFYGNATLFWLNKITNVEVAAAGVTAANAHEFIYHVTVNDSIEIMPWSQPANFRSNKHITYAYLGKFDTQNKIVKIEFYNIKNYKDKITWVLNGSYMPPAAVKLVVLGYNNKYLFRPFKQGYVPYNEHHYFPQDQDNTKAITFNWSDSINHVRVVMKNTIQNDMYDVYLKRTVNNKTDTVFISNNWAISYYSHDPQLYINSSYFNKPGKYEAIIVPEAPDDFKINSMDKAVKIPFTVLPAKTQSFTALQLLMIIGLVILIAVILFLIYYFINKRRSAKIAQQKEMATLELQSVRSQLNPHFIFNTLAGIQNLMNKGDINATNRYLSKFSRITRNVLDDKNKEAITINEEVSLLEDYLQMEQMRFGFNYNIYVDEKIDRANTEIPSMLLQPYIENAVKHGVSSLKQAGIIAIAILLKSGSLVMEVKDNGNGYDTNLKAAGNGTVLSEKRVDLINQINKNNTISVSKKSDLSGTTISIELNNWI